jgi:hypothetical protein
MSISPAITPSARVVAYLPAPVRETLATMSRVRNVSMSNLVLEALSAHFAGLGIGKQSAPVAPGAGHSVCPAP